MYIYVYIYIYIIYMKTVNVKTTSVLISILLHTEDCVYRAVSKRCLFSLRVKKKKKQSLHSEKKKSIKIQRLFWNSAAWILTRFCWERVQALGEGSGTGMSSRQRSPCCPATAVWPQMRGQGSGRRHTQTHRKTQVVIPPVTTDSQERVIPGPEGGRSWVGKQEGKAETTRALRVRR